MKLSGDRTGNPPAKRARLEVEFSTYQKALHEDVPLYRQPDHRHLEASRSRQPGTGAVPRARHQQRHVLQMARQVRQRRT